MLNAWERNQADKQNISLKTQKKLLQVTLLRQDPLYRFSLMLLQGIEKKIHIVFEREVYTIDVDII